MKNIFLSNPFGLVLSEDSCAFSEASAAQEVEGLVVDRNLHFCG
jgi:hypothetical protein